MATQIEEETIPHCLLKAGWHPIQIKALTIFTDRVASPKMIAAELRLPVNSIAYHVRQLKKRQLIEIVEEKKRRGAIEHFYRAIERPLITTEEWEQLSIEHREEFSGWIIELWIRDLTMAMRARTFDKSVHRHLSRIPLCLDTQGFRELAWQQHLLMEKALEIQAESDQRRADSGEEGAPACCLMTTFHSPSVEAPFTNLGD